MNTIELEVEGMSCGSCIKHVKEALQSVPGISDINVDLNSGHVWVSSELQQSSDALISALDVAGYPAKLANETGIVSETMDKHGEKPKGSCCCS